MDHDRRLQQWVTSFGTAVPLIVTAMISLTIPTSIAARIGLTPEELTSWIVAAFGSSIFGVYLTWRYQQPLLLVTNIFVIVFYASVADDYTYAEFIGATILAGVVIILGSTVGLLDWISRAVPMPVVFGMLAGIVLPFVIQIFDSLGDEPIMIGATLVAYLTSLKFLGTRLPAVLPALIAGTLAAVITGRTGSMPESIPLPSLVFTMPTLSVGSVIAVTPVLVMVLTVQSTIPSIMYLRKQGYDPPERRIHNAGGMITAIGSFAGPIGMSLSLPATSLLADPLAGNHRFRHHAVYIAASVALLIACTASIAAEIPTVLPLSLLTTIAGLALLTILVNALRDLATSALTLGPVFAFAIVLSDISLLGFGPLFWAVSIGSGVSLIFERKGQRVTSGRPEQP